MALVKELETRICLVWKTERPFRDRPRKSNEFSLLDSAWYLQMNSDLYCNDGFFHYVISLRQGTKCTNLEKGFRVTTFIEDQVSHNFPSIGCSKYVRTTNEVIWEFDEDVVSKKTSHFNDYGEWRIVCLFHGVPSMLQTKIQTKHLSTQTDLGSDLESLSLDLSNFLERKEFPDVTLTCGGSTISAHRSILAARSQTFADMFRNSESGVVDIANLDAPVLDLLLKGLYSGKIPDLSDETASNLYAASVKYRIDSLKNACSDRMIEGLTEGNCARFLDVADAFSDVTLKDTVISFICNHQQVLKSKKWEKFSEERPKLAVEVYQNFIRSMK